MLCSILYLIFLIRKIPKLTYMNLKKKISFICFSALAVLMLMNQISCAEKVVEGKLSVTPVPSEVKCHNGVFKLNSSTTFTVDALEIDKSNLTSYLLASPLNIKSSDTEEGDNRIVLKVVPYCKWQLSLRISLL